MAIYHMTVKTGSRGNGQSAVASAAYRSGESLCDERTGEVFDYRQKKGVVAKGFLAPDHAKDWAYDRSKLWNAVERAEKRKDARTFREIEMALPAELTLEQQKDLVRSWVKAELVSRGMCVDICVHDTGKGNPHAHIMCTTRDLTADGEGFAGKNRDWDKKDLLKELRQSWANECNQALEMAGHESRVDHRSHRERGIEMEPQLHHGNRSGLMMKNEEIKSRNVERVELPKEADALIAIAGARAEQERERQAAEREQKEAEAQARFEAQVKILNDAREARRRKRAEAEAEKQKQEAAKAAPVPKAKPEEVAREIPKAEPEPVKSFREQIREAVEAPVIREMEQRRAAERATIDVDLAKTSEKNFTAGAAWELAHRLNAERIQLRQDIEASEARGRIAKFFAPTNPEAIARLKELDAKVNCLWGMDRWFKQGGQTAREADLRDVPELRAEVNRWQSNHALAVKHGIVKSEEQLRQESIDRAIAAAKAPAKAKTQEHARTQNKGRSGPDRGGHSM